MQFGPNAGDEESSLLGSSPSRYSSYPLEVDQVERKYVNQVSDGSRSLVKFILRLLLAAFCGMVLIASYPFVKQYLADAEGASNFKSNAGSDESMKSASTNDKPNFVFFLLDDAGWNTVGREDYDIGFLTPFTNTLIRKGITLDNYYSQHMCTPARAALMTGRYPVTLGMQYLSVGATSESGVPVTEVLISNVLKSLGSYVNHIFGKWNLGHYHAQYLPTARGFDTFLGYLDVGTFYWSKLNPTYESYYDFIYSDKNCYKKYDGADISTYSTTLYTNKAVDSINTHDFDTSPMFLYMAYQAAHEPWFDYNNTYSTGIPKEYVDEDSYNRVMKQIIGGERRQYALSMRLVDMSIKTIYEAMESVGQANNTYFIITSDNGGCYKDGGKNGPLRGSKGSLFEGGTKVFAYIASDLLPTASQGKSYGGLFHITDWFPTMLGLANLEYVPDNDHTLDGVDHSSSLLLTGSSDDITHPRDNMVYNIFVNVSSKPSWTLESSVFAVRDNQYKLIHAYTDNYLSKIFMPYDVVENDDVIWMIETACTEDVATSGSVYEKFLFDLVNDPYESTNLYYNGTYAEVLESLYAKVSSTTVKYQQATQSCSIKSDITTAELSACESVWTRRDFLMQPWNFEVVSGSAYPSYCGSSTA